MQERPEIDPQARVGRSRALIWPLAVFAVLESGYKECWVTKNGGVYAIDPDDPQDAIEAVRRWLGQGFASSSV